MSKSMSRFLAVSLLLSCLALPAQADDHRRHDGGDRYGYNQNRYDGRHDHGHHNGWSNRDWDRYSHRYGSPRVIYQPPVYVTRTYIQPDYYQPTYQEPDCAIGDRLVMYRPVPQPVLMRMQPAPRGYYYSMSGRHVVMASYQGNVINQIFSALAW